MPPSRISLRSACTSAEAAEQLAVAVASRQPEGVPSSAKAAAAVIKSCQAASFAVVASRTMSSDGTGPDR
jgi:hypothetical protein